MAQVTRSIIQIAYADQRRPVMIAAEFKNNHRTAAELMLAYRCHEFVSFNSADEPFTTPSEEWISSQRTGRRSYRGIRNFQHTMNMLSGSPGMKAVERAVEAAILDEFREIGDSVVFWQRSKIISAQPNSERSASL